MTAAEYLQERQRFEAHLIAKAWADPAFRDQLLKDPRGTMEAELATFEPGATLAPGLKVNIIVEPPDEVCIVLPANPETAEPDVLESVSSAGCSCKNQGCDKCFIQCGQKTCTDKQDVPIGPIGLPGGTILKPT